VFNKYRAPALFNSGKNDIVNFADTFQKEDLGVKNLIFEKENKNDKVEDEDRVIKDKKKTELRVVIFNNLLFTIVISRR